MWHLEAAPSPKQPKDDSDPEPMKRFRAQGLVFRVKGLGFRVTGL